MNNATNTHETKSVLASLRAVIPTRENVTYDEALRTAELHANRLLELHDIDDGPVPWELISELPKIRIDYVAAPVSGASFWSMRDRVWIIQLNRADSRARQRFTLAHEYKHIVDHGTTELLYRGSGSCSPTDQAERAADFFAGCLLVPRRFLKRAWGQGVQRTDALAELFQVSEQAIRVRLLQTGLVDRQPRCETNSRSKSIQLNQSWRNSFNRQGV